MEQLGETTKIYDAIVIGAGAMGSAAAYTLAKRGKDTLLVEQFPLPHNRGSSQGASRVTRLAYLEQFNANIMKIANPMWRKLEQESGMKLFRKTGMLATSSTQHELVTQYNQTLEDYWQKTLPLMDGKTMSADYYPMKFPASESGCNDTTAGILYASKCLHAFQKVFEENGGVIADNHKVLDITPGDIMTVNTDKCNFQSRGVIITCGSWSSQVLGKIGISLPLEVEAMQVCYWKAKPGVDHNALPTFIRFYDDYSIYGLPPDEYSDMMKICLHNGRPCDPDLRDLIDHEEEEKDLAKVKEFVAEIFPGLIPVPAIKERCLYTNTPDNVCIIDHHPKYKNIAYGAGFSGRGFKQAPVIGKMLADIVLHQKTSSLLVDQMRAQRFTKKAHL